MGLSGLALKLWGLVRGEMHAELCVISGRQGWGLGRTCYPHPGRHGVHMDYSLNSEKKKKA